MLTRCRAIRLIEGCPRLNIRGISLPLSGLMGRINNAAHSCWTPAGYRCSPRLLQLRMARQHSSVDADGKSMCFPRC
ncbi:hypothetical protein CesoFtcFv8_010264 [Champsocephalus esox]|uniref:Uncharacterized protein n=1 Tax=Champsocephalus esox TaxID=159716 RepID=A0AAN8C8L5_9TELE|nr:hypothetical protein CesoFtcFv8_010264 [Champsocephalus esox]